MLTNATLAQPIGYVFSKQHAVNAIQIRRVINHIENTYREGMRVFCRMGFI